MKLVTPKAGAKHELLFNKTASENLTNKEKRGFFDLFKNEAFVIFFCLGGYSRTFLQQSDAHSKSGDALTTKGLQ